MSSLAWVQTLQQLLPILLRALTKLLRKQRAMAVGQHGPAEYLRAVAVHLGCEDVCLGAVRARRWPRWVGPTQRYSMSRLAGAPHFLPLFKAGKIPPAGRPSSCTIHTA